MSKSILIPTEEDKGLESKLASHFGRAPYFYIIQLNEEGKVVNFKAIANQNKCFGRKFFSLDSISGEKVDVVIAYRIGPSAFTMIRNAGITLLEAKGERVNEVITFYKEAKLKELKTSESHGRMGCSCYEKDHNES